MLTVKHLSLPPRVSHTTLSILACSWTPKQCGRTVSSPRLCQQEDLLSQIPELHHQASWAGNFAFLTGSTFGELLNWEK